MAEHGTRTMYVHYGCRCDECCKAEHKQYLKRKEAQSRKRTHSKWHDALDVECKTTRQRLHNANRYKAIKETGAHTRPISWRAVAEKYEMKCAICGCKVDPEDTWVEASGRKCYGRRYPTADHIIPLKHGGADVIDNIQLACKRCNSKKGARLDAFGSL